MTFTKNSFDMKLKGLFSKGELVLFTLISIFLTTYFVQGYNVFSLLIVAASIWLYSRYSTVDIGELPIKRLIQLIVFALLLNTMLIGVLTYIDAGQRSMFKAIEYPGKMVVFSIIILAMLRVRMLVNVLALGLIGGTLVAFSVSGYDFYILDRRGLTDYMPIQKGNAAILYSSLLYIIALYYWNKEQIKWGAVCLVGANVALAASIMSLTRGGWVLQPFILVLIAIFFFEDKIKKLILLSLTSFVLTTSLIVASKPEAITDRVAVVVTEAQQETGSAGIRVQLWKSAWQNFLAKPIIGWGELGIQPQLDMQYQSGLLSEISRSKDGNAHSAYLNALSKMGIVGFIGLMGIFLVPGFIFLYFFIKKYNDLNVRLYASLGGVSILSTMGFCVTQDHFTHNDGVVLYGVLISLFIGCMFRNLAKSK